jgi:YgiT-type zinc finger domain-containing protein
MKCRVCGGRMESIRTDLPFKIDDRRIIVIKDIPVEQCIFCSEYELHDSVMEKLEYLLTSMDKTSELEVRSFAA